MIHRPARLFAGAALAFALLWSGWLGWTHLGATASVLDRVEASAADLRFLAAGSRKAPDDVLIVAIDDAAATLAGAFPLPRDRMAGIVTTLLAYGAQSVALDLLFFDPGQPDKDAALAQALKGGATVIGATAMFGGAAQDAAGALPKADSVIAPVAPFRSAARVGLTNISTDISGIPRFAPMLIQAGTTLWPAFSLRAAQARIDGEFGGALKAVTAGGALPLDLGGFLPLRFYGPEGTIPTVSAAAVLRGSVDPGLVRGRVVLVGATANGTGDRFASPFDPVLPGVEVEATAVANLVTGQGLTRTLNIRRVDAAIAVGLSVVTALLFCVRTIELGLLGATGLLAAFLLFAFVTFAHGTWFSVAVPLAAVLPVAVVTAAGRLALDRLIEARLSRQEATLRVFQPPAIAARLAADPDFLAKPVERDIAVLFIDLTGFTGMTERLGPQTTRDLIAEFHALIEDEVARFGGVVASYMGDGAMILFGLEGRGGDAGQALRTTIALRNRSRHWVAEACTRVGLSLGVKFGGHYGAAVLSRLGHVTHQHITAIGDTVNVAARLMEVAAEYKYDTALSARLVERAVQDGVTAAGLDLLPPRNVAIRGRATPLSVRFVAIGEAEA